MSVEHIGKGYVKICVSEEELENSIAANFARAANYTAARATIAESRTDGLMSMP